MVSHKAVRVLVVGISAVGFFVLQACVAPSGDSASDVNVGVDPSVKPQGGPGDARLSTCIPVKVKGYHSQDFAQKNPFMGNSRISKIVQSRTKPSYGRPVVPCVHSDTGEVKSCVFHTDQPNIHVPYDPIKQVGNSGSWLLGADGNRYAQVGQMIGLDGTVGGDWVVATPVDTKRQTVTCVEPKGGTDAVGTSTGMELAGSCVVETLNSPVNATGLSLRNVATQSVCMGNDVHPDGALQTDKPAPGIWCYTGDGAAINDLNGTERDAYGVYLVGSEFCHVAWSNGYEVPAAKRPQTKVFPPPGKVVETSPLAWRAVHDKLPIANP